MKPVKYFRLRETRRWKAACQKDTFDAYRWALSTYLTLYVDTELEDAQLAEIVEDVRNTILQSPTLQFANHEPYLLYEDLNIPRHEMGPLTRRQVAVTAMLVPSHSIHECFFDLAPYRDDPHVRSILSAGSAYSKDKRMDAERYFGPL